MFVFFDDNDAVVAVKSNFEVGGIEVPDSVRLSDIKTKLDVYKQLKLIEIRTAYQARIDGITKGYAQYEVDSFADQRAEWRAWKADDTTPTPVVDTLALARGINREELLAKIEANVLAITTIQGEQNALEDKIKACTTLEELEEIRL